MLVKGSAAPTVTVSTSYSVDFRANLGDLAGRPGVCLDIPFAGAPLAGNWSFVPEGDQASKFTIRFAHAWCPPGSIWPSAQVKVVLRVRLGDHHAQYRDVHASGPSRTGPLPGAETTRALSLCVDMQQLRAMRDLEVLGQCWWAGTQQYRAVLTLSLKRGNVPVDRTLALAQRTPETTHTPVPHDVRIFFPHVGKDGAELWTTAALLSSTSDYFKDLLASKFAESVVIGSKRARRSPPPAVRPPMPDRDFQDSDDETDEGASPSSLYDLDRAPSFSYQQITVTQAAHATYRAALRYFETNFIHFAPSSSSTLPNLASASETRADRISSMVAAQPALPIPVSPKSTYRLARLIGLKYLQDACLVELAGQLTPEVAAVELFDRASTSHDEWRAVIVAYAVRHWDKVAATKSWKDAEARIRRRELPEAAPIVLELMEARTSDA